MNKKLKLSMSTLSFHQWELDELLATCKENDIKGIELRLGLSDWSRSDMNEEQCGHLLSQLQAFDMKITNLGSCVCVNKYNQEALERLEQDMMLAKRLGVTGLRIMFGTYRNRWSEEGITLDYEGICRWIKEADLLAQKYECQLWLETHYEFATGKMLKQLFEDCQLVNCRVIWDVMHPLEQQESIAETFSYIKEYLVHVHMKDGCPWQDSDMANWKYTKIGEGKIPLEDFVKMLLDNGYEGYFSLEWEPMWHEEIRGIDTGLVLADYGRWMKQYSNRA